MRKGEAAIAAYVGKYLEGGLVIKKHSWKGCRRVEYDRRAKHAWLACSRGFAWHSAGARTWRARVGQVGAVLGVGDTEGILRKLGPKWAYRLRETITSAMEQDWQLVLRGLTLIPKALPPCDPPVTGDCVELRPNALRAFALLVRIIRTGCAQSLPDKNAPSASSIPWR